jgi:hypothetical protein
MDPIASVLMGSSGEYSPDPPEEPISSDRSSSAEPTEPVLENVIVFETEALSHAFIEPRASDPGSPPEPDPEVPVPPPPRSARPGHGRRPPPDVDRGAVPNLTQQFLASKPVACEDPELLAVVVHDLEDQRDRLMLDGSFMESMKAQRAVDAARAQQLDSVKRRNQSEAQDEIRAKQASVQHEYDQFLRDMREQEQDLENRIQQQIQETKNRQRQELEEHDQDWQADQKQRLFNRTSQKLRILRTQQQLLMNARRFDEAAHVCRIADGLAVEECSASHRQMLVAFLQSRGLLEQRHEQNMDTLMKAAENRRGEFQHTKEAGSRRFRNRIAILQLEEAVAKDPERLWVLKHRNDGDQVVNCSGTASRPARLPPRTANVRSFNVLPLPPLTVPAFLKKAR